jgi:hypothetical protein
MALPHQSCAAVIRQDWLHSPCVWCCAGLVSPWRRLSRSGWCGRSTRRLQRPRGQHPHCRTCRQRSHQRCVCVMGVGEGGGGRPPVPSSTAQAVESMPYRGYCCFAVCCNDRLQIYQSTVIVTTTRTFCTPRARLASCSRFGWQASSLVRPTNLVDVPVCLPVCLSVCLQMYDDTDPTRTGFNDIDPFYDPTDRRGSDAFRDRDQFWKR